MPQLETPKRTASPAAAESSSEKLNTKAASVVGCAVLCSRVLGLAREQIFAALFGGGRWLDPGFGPRALLGAAVGTLVGGALQLAVQLPALHRVGYVFHPDFRWRDSAVKATLRLMGPSVLAASTTQVNVLVNSGRRRICCRSSAH